MVTLSLVCWHMYGGRLGCAARLMWLRGAGVTNCPTGVLMRRDGEKLKAAAQRGHCTPSRPVHVCPALAPAQPSPQSGYATRSRTGKLQVSSAVNTIVQRLQNNKEWVDMELGVFCVLPAVCMPDARSKPDSPQAGPSVAAPRQPAPLRPPQRAPSPPPASPAAAAASSPRRPSLDAPLLVRWYCPIPSGPFFAHHETSTSRSPLKSYSGTA